MQVEVVKNTVEHGWYEEYRTFGEDIALLHSEVSEALEAYRTWGAVDPTPVHYWGDPLPKPEGVGSEFADVLIRLLDSCARYDIDLEWEYERKAVYNQSRPYKHGGKKL
jgi:NTP pyrophosphatase (non-canonical NTP hydrolase)